MQVNLNNWWHMGLIIAVKVIPRSGRQQVLLDAAGVLRCYIKSAPEDGKANKELIKMLSSMVGLPHGALCIVAGATFRLKKVAIETRMTYEELLKLLGCEVQDALF